MSGVDLVKRLRPGFPQTRFFLCPVMTGIHPMSVPEGRRIVFHIQAVYDSGVHAKVREILALSQSRRRVLVADDEPASEICSVRFWNRRVLR